MKTIGLIGGMSWESSLEYYRLINEAVHQKLGGYHSAKCILVSVDFAEIEGLQHQSRWDDAADQMAAAAKQLEAAGADFLVLCTNTMHKSAAAIQAAVQIPFLHIADPTARAIKAQHFQKVALLGTQFTMEQDFYRGRLEQTHGLTVIIPDVLDRETVHRVIYDELVHGKIHESSRLEYRRIIKKLCAQGAQGVILGCTEIGLLVKQEDSSVPIFDTTTLHALAAVEFVLAD